MMLVRDRYPRLDFKHTYSKKRMKKAMNSVSAAKDMEHDKKLLNRTIARMFVHLQKCQMTPVLKPSMDFTDPAFHKWETNLGAALAEHITKFRDDTVALINERILKVNQFIEDKTVVLVAYNHVLDSYGIEDFRQAQVDKKAIVAKLSSAYKTITNQHNDTECGNGPSCQMRRGSLTTKKSPTAILQSFGTFA